MIANNALKAICPRLYNQDNSLTNAFQWVFWIKPIARLILKHKISGSYMISDQSLLLSTTIYVYIYD